MTKQDLVNVVAEKTGFPKTQVLSTIDSTLQEIKNSLKEDEQVTLKGFANFKTKERAARIARNLKTGEPVNVPSKIIAVIKPSKELIDSLN